MHTLVLLFSYNRPTLLREALESLNESESKNFSIALIDDGSNFDVNSVAQATICEELRPRLFFMPTNDTQEQKEVRGGSIFGKFANEAMATIPSDLVIMLCDDDKIYPSYIGNLEKFFIAHPEIMYCHSHVIPYDPWSGQNHKEAPYPGFSYWLNREGFIDPFCQVDSSQVCWRTSCSTEGGVQFPWPQTAALDSVIYGQLRNTYGLCAYSEFIGQWKANGRGTITSRGVNYLSSDKEV